MKDLPNSVVDRKNILNNSAALRELYGSLDFEGVLFEQKYRYTKQQIANYFHVDIRTINRLLEVNRMELEQSGQEVFAGVRLKQFKDLVSQLKDINVPQLMDDEENELVGARATSLNVFTFKAFLNVAMLLQGSEKAKQVRGAILDIVIDVLNKKLGGTTKFVNQREESYVPAALREFNYRQEFTNALDNYIGDYTFKYSQLTDKIYLCIFKENAKEYRQILKLSNSESVRSTMYSEVLDLISAYENGFADLLRKEFEKKGEKLRLSEANKLFKDFESTTDMAFQPLKEKARSLMASRDMAFRDALHEQLNEYISAVSPEDFEKFLGEKSKSLEERLTENMDVFIRLKDK
ncbi:DNA-binding protein [Pedobacter psychrodurus]|uniref:DNA-binding protein n=1 Tax=Pedobacter psychrodurus TaxID=2530456 RepID=A0A4V2MRG6_9SPHI|nr:DNA-binding protein [Pedobacter psychrodurus]TCD29634.1 DNA-binding protein [Pedobacter psychrodurus]